MHPHELARELERAPRRHQLADALRIEARRHRLDCLFLPPLMGMGEHRRLMRALNDLGTRAAEILASPPSVPGLRLRQALEGAQQRAGIPIVHDRATGFRSRSAQITGIDLHGGKTLEADAFVLASGKFIGRGLVHDRRLYEPLFDLPVWIDEEGPGPTYLGKQMSRSVSGPHPLMRAGLRVSPRLQPLGSDGQVAWANLYGAGSVLGGYDYITGRCGLGTAFVTGSWAGARAAGVDPVKNAGGEP
jgi:glycerol-3-phosphate dehydrogenase subunit B